MMFAAGKNAQERNIQALATLPSGLAYSVLRCVTRPHLEHFSLIFPMSLRRSVYSGSLRGSLHRCAIETCSARIDPHTVFALAPRANRLKNALGHAYTITLSSAQSERRSEEHTSEL